MRRHGAVLGPWARTVVRPLQRRPGFKPFSDRDEAQLVQIVTTRPRHVMRHVRQLVWRSRKRDIQFRNTVASLMVVLQDQLRKQLVDPANAASVMEGVLEECVKMQQFDMAQLTFRAFMRYRRYGCTIRVDALTRLFEAYRSQDGCEEMMAQLADEFKMDPQTRGLCIAANLFAGRVEQAEAMRAALAVTALNSSDVVGLLEGYFHRGLGAKALELMAQVPQMRMPPDGVREIIRCAVRCAAKRNDATAMQRAIQIAQTLHTPLDGDIFAHVMRLRLGSVQSGADVAAVEDELKGMGYVPDVTTSSIVVSALTRLARSGDKGSEEIMLSKVETLLGTIEQRMREGDAELDIGPAHIRAVIRGYGAAQRPDLLQAAWPRLKQGGLCSDVRIYNELLKWYSLMGNVRDVLKTKDEMTQEAIALDHISYLWILRSLGKWYPNQVNGFFREMKEKDVRPDMPLYVTLLGIFGDLGEWTTVDELLEEIAERHRSGYVAYSPVFFAVMLRLYRTNLPKAEAMYEMAKVHGFGQHHHVVCSMMHTYASMPEASEAEQKMDAFATNISVRTADYYNVLLNFYSKRNDATRVHDLLSQMQREGVVMNDVTYGTLITAFGRWKDQGSVLRIIEQLRSQEAPVSATFYSVLAAAFNRGGDGQGVSDAWDDLISAKLNPDTEVYNNFLTLYAKAHNFPKLQSVMGSMMEKVPPNPITATTVLDLLGKGGRIADVEALFEQMKASPDAQPTTVTYHQVLNAYAKAGDCSKMMTLHQEMINKGFTDTHVTFNIIADGLGRAKRFEQLNELVARRMEDNKGFDELGYCVLLSAYGRVRMQGDVHKIIADLHSRNPSLVQSRKIAWTIIDALCRCGNTQEMMKWISHLADVAQSVKNETSTSINPPSDATKKAESVGTTTVETPSSGEVAPSSTEISPSSEGATTPPAEATPSSEEATPKSEGAANLSPSHLSTADKMTVLSYYARAGMVDHLEDVLQQLAKAGETLSYGALNTLARGFARAGRFERCVVMLHQMRDRQWVPDASTTLVLANLFIKSGLHEQAQQIVQWRRQFVKATGAEPV